MGPACFLFVIVLSSLFSAKPGRKTCTKQEAAIVNLDGCLYLLLFLILVGLFVWSLLRREKGGNDRRGDRGASEAGTEGLGEGDQGE
jgi:hypothetical protein